MAEGRAGSPEADVPGVRISGALRRAARAMPRDCTFSGDDWRVLSRFWHPVAYCEEVTSQPVRAKLLDVDLVVYRTSAGVVVARDICLHRGAMLSLGHLEGDELVCAYHGWRYGPAGACTKIPSQPSGRRISPGIRLLTCPAREQHGLIWCCLAGEPTADLPAWPETSDPAFRQLHLAPQAWNTSAARQVENFLDVSHFAFVHRQTFGNAASTEIPPIPVQPTGSGLRYGFSYQAANPAGSPLGAAPAIGRETSYELTLPFAAKLTIAYPDKGPGARHVLIDVAQPVSAKSMRLYLLIARNFDPGVPARDLLSWEEKIVSQDRPIVESQRPEELPLDLGQELHVQADSMTIAYRRELARLGLGCGQ
ncbi:MAG TPA: aromatic ring-hydroxylating dioxygenase subunit alpha [Streptosporangiaceae bacterium]